MLINYIALMMTDLVSTQQVVLIGKLNVLLVYGCVLGTGMVWCALPLATTSKSMEEAL